MNQVTLKNLYEQDFSAWIQRHIDILQQRKFVELDIEHLIQELEDMGKSNKNEIVSRLIILLAHLLKWQFQHQQLVENWQGWEGKSWRHSIIEQRIQIIRLVNNNPSLKSHLSEVLTEAYPFAVKQASKVIIRW